MDKESFTQEYKEFLGSLEKKKHLIFEFGKLENYKDREDFLNKYSNDDLINVFNDDEFLKLFYLEAQTDYLQERFKFNPKDTLKTLIYCYNTNSREFNKKLVEDKLRKDLVKKGFKEVNLLEDDLKSLDKLNVVCVFDKDRIGLMGSFTEKETHEGTLIYNGNLCFLPKRHTKTGQILRTNFYYKEI